MGITEYSAQEMFLLRPLLLQGLSDLSECFQRSHTGRQMPQALSLSKLQRKSGREEHQKTPSDMEK